MAKIAKKHTDKLEDMKRNVTVAHDYFEHNYKSYDDFMRFIFITTLTSAQVAKLNGLQKWAGRFNVLEAYLSRMLGEWMLNEPGVEVKAAYGLNPAQMSPQFLDTMTYVEAHLRDILFSNYNDKFSYQIFRDQIAGGFGVAEVFIDYCNDMSFEKNIYLERIVPTLAFFDPKAQESHKGDGDFCGRVMSYTEKEFGRYFGKDTAKDMSFTKNIGGFAWSYYNQKEKTILVADYYEKKKYKETIVQLPSGMVMSEDDFMKDVERYNQRDPLTISKYILPPSAVNTRNVDAEKICRYRICENEVLEYKETEFRQFPLVFFDGNSVLGRVDNSDTFRQVTRSYFYNAMDAQRLKDLAGQSQAAEIENLIQTKMIAPLEGIPEEYINRYTEFQKLGITPYKSFVDGDPNMRLAPPQIVQREQTPQIIAQTFMASDSVIQSTLGSYDAEMGIQGGDISGKAIQQGSLQSNKAADPYKNGYIRGLNRVAQIIVNLIPLIYKTPRSIPITMDDGTQDYKIINDTNQEDAVYMNYSPHDLMVNVSVGASFSTQKQVAVDQMTKMMQISPVFNQFMSTEGLPVLLDNMEFSGADRLKVMFDKFLQQNMQEQSQMQQMQQQQIAMQAQLQQMDMQIKQFNAQTNRQKVNNEEAYRIAQILQDQKQNEAEQEIDVANVEINKQNADTNYIAAIAKVRQDRLDSAIRAEEIDAENARTETLKTATVVDTALKIDDHIHQKAMDVTNLGINEQKVKQNGKANNKTA